MNCLKKREYTIPEIEVPPTLSSDEESDEESGSDEDAPEV